MTAAYFYLQNKEQVFQQDFADGLKKQNKTKTLLQLNSKIADNLNGQKG